MIEQLAREALAELDQVGFENDPAAVAHVDRAEEKLKEIEQIAAGMRARPIRPGDDDHPAEQIARAGSAHDQESRPLRRQLADGSVAIYPESDETRARRVLDR